MQSLWAMRARTGPVAGLAVMLVLAVACDRTPGASGASAPPNGSAPAGPSGTPQDFACASVREMTPPEAGDFLEARGWDVAWRWNTTTGEIDGQPEGNSEVVTEPSDGVIFDVATADGQAIVFVAPPGDPILEIERENACTQDES